MSAPFPTLSFSDIASFIRSPSKDLPPPVGYNALTWYESGAEGLAGICAYLSAKKNQKLNVYLPGYFCGQSLRYLRSLPVNFIFYHLTEDLQPIYPEAQLDKPTAKIDVFIHVHYFGKIFGQENSRRFADKHGAVLIEDCAHLISPLIDINWVGDYLVFSPHKHFPLPKVGMVFSKENYLGNQPRKVQAFPIIWVFKQVAKMFNISAPKPKWGPKWTNSIDSAAFTESNHFIKKATLRCLMSCKSDIDIRTKNAAMLTSKIKKLSGWKLLPFKGSSQNHYLLGVICDDVEISENRFNILNERSQIIMQWPDLPQEIKNNTEMATESANLYSRSLFFFVHQRLPLNEVMKNLDYAMSVKGF